MNEISIVKVTLKDIDQLQAIGKQTFFDTFSSQNNEDDMQNYLLENFSELKLTNELSNPDSEFYFAILDGNPVGYLKVNLGQSQTEINHENTLEIERIYVLQQFHGKQVGQQLYRKAIELAKENQVDYVWLGVWEENPRAIAFYKKNGFVEFDKHIFKLGDDEQTDIMMKLTLK